MNIDLRKLYTFKKILINEKVIIPEDYYQNMDIIRMSEITLNGEIFINHEDEIELNCEAKGNFVMPCSISLEEVSCEFNKKIEEIIDEKILNNEISLALLDILWENIVLEVPMKVVKEGITRKNLKGEGWELESS